MTLLLQTISETPLLFPCCCPFLCLLAVCLRLPCTCPLLCCAIYAFFVLCLILYAVRACLFPCWRDAPSDYTHILLPLYFYSFSFLEKRASPGIEPGPPAPKAGILPLNYKAFLLYYLSSCCPPDIPTHPTVPAPVFITTYPPFKKGGFGGNRTRATCTLSRYFTT